MGKETNGFCTILEQSMVDIHHFRGTKIGKVYWETDGRDCEGVDRQGNIYFKRCKSTGGRFDPHYLYDLEINGHVVLQNVTTQRIMDYLRNS